MIFAANKRMMRWVLVLICVAVAVITVSLFAHKNSSGSTQQVLAINETGNVSAVQTSLAPSVVSAALAPSATPSSLPSSTDLPEPDPLGSIVFKKGMTDPLVPFIQQRLMDLQYLSDAQPTAYYGPLTQEAVMCFQRAAGLPTDGCVGSQTYTTMISPNAPLYAVGLGAKGSDVEDMVSRLHELGYIGTTPDTFTAAVKTAVQKFQKTNGIAVDGIIGEATREMLYSEKAKEYTSSSANQSSNINLTGNITQKTNLKPTRLESILPSALKGLGTALYSGEQQYKINSLFVLSIIKYESGNGKSNLAQTQNNLGGIKSPNGTYRAFSSKEECVDYMFNLLRSKYIGEGLTTIPAVGNVYCTGNTWASNVTRIMQDLIEECNG